MNNFYEYKMFYDEPIPLKKDLLVYPITVRDYFNFYMCADILTIEKDRIPDIKIIKMTYFDFICDLIIKENQSDSEYKPMTIKFFSLLELCLKISAENMFIDKDVNGFYFLKLLYENKNFEEKDDFDIITIDSKEFEIMREIICSQNLIELPDMKIDPEMKKALDEALAFKNKNAKKMGSFEDQIVCILISTNLKCDDIYNLTLRKFQKILQRVDFKLHYEIYKTAESTGSVTFKKPIDHWMSDISNDKYEGLISETEDMVDGFNGKQKEKGE